jgi:hypothetical protein
MENQYTRDQELADAIAEALTKNFLLQVICVTRLFLKKPWR